MSKFELVPINEANPDKTGEELFECLKNEQTRAQLEQFLPGALSYGDSLETAQQRIKANQEAARADSRFDPLVQVLDERAIGMAVIDERLRAKRCAACDIPLGEIALSGPNTSSWIASDYQGQGLGKASLEKRIDRTREAGHDGLWTVVDDENTVSAHNVANRGFTPVYQGRVSVAEQYYRQATVSQYLFDSINVKHYISALA